MRRRITFCVVTVAVAGLLGIRCGGDDTVDTGNDPGADSGPGTSTTDGGSTDTTTPDMGGYGGGYRVN
jgi:hypothetical protein